MNTHDNGMREHGIFIYNDNSVIGYSLWGGGGGITSVFSFLTKKDAISFYNLITGGNGSAILNGSQVVFFGDYRSALAFIPEHRIEFRTFSRGGMYV